MIEYLVLVMICPWVVSYHAVQTRMNITSPHLASNLITANLTGNQPAVSSVARQNQTGSSNSHENQPAVSSVVRQNQTASPHSHGYQHALAVLISHGSHGAGNSQHQPQDGNSLHALCRKVCVGNAPCPPECSNLQPWSIVKRSLVQKEPHIQETDQETLT